MFIIRIRTQNRSEMISLNKEIERIIRENDFWEGLCVVFVPHTTAGLTVNENADPDVKRDILDALDKLVPWNGDYRHAEGNSAAHLKASLMGFTLNLFVEKGRLVLGTWQDVFLVEFDGPRDRKVYVTLL